MVQPITYGLAPALGTGIDLIFNDTRDRADQRRNRGSGSAPDTGAFVNCRRDDDNDRRGRSPLIRNASWWLQRNYLDWETSPNTQRALGR